MLPILLLLVGLLPPPDDDFSGGGYSLPGQPSGFSITWEYIAPNPNCAVSRTAAVLGSDNKIHLVCGNCPTHGSHPYDEVYDPVANSWQRGLTYPGGAGVHNHSAVRLGSRIYVGGGRQGSGSTDDMTVIDLSSNTWSVIGKMPNQGIPHYYYQFAASGNRIYMFGGIKSDTILTAETWCYDPVANSWSARKPMPQAKMSVAAAAIGDTILVCGGSASYPNGSRGVYAYDCVGDTWVTASDSMPEATFWASGHAIADPDTGWLIFVVGGQNRTNYLNWVQKKHARWTTETPITASRRSHGGTQKGCSLYVFCGWNGAGVSTAERGRVDLIGVKEEWTPGPQAGNRSRVAIHANPTRGPLIVHLASDRARNLEIRLFDITGRCRAILFRGLTPAGRRTLPLPATGFAPGIYFLDVTGFDRPVRHKVIITK